MLSSLLNVSPIFLFLFIGIILRLSNKIRRESIKDIKFIVANITLPALLFKGFLEVTFGIDFIYIILIMFCLPIVMLGVGHLSNKVLRINSNYFPYTLAGFENGMLGYALFLTIFGSENLPVMATVDLGQGLFVFIILLPIMKREINGEKGVKNLLKSLVSSPVIIAIFLGLLLGFFNPLAGNNSIIIAGGKFIELLGNLTMPLIMISIGYEISFKKSGLRKALTTVLFRNVLLIISGLLINNFIVSALHLPKIYEYAILLMFIMPPPFIISIFMDQDDIENLSYVTNTLSISTILSLILIIPLLP